MPFAEFTPNVVQALALLTIVGQVIALALAALILTEIFGRRHTKAGGWIARWGLVITFIVALTATGGSLFFSEIAQWTPCKLCWFQRIFMYPQVPLLALALWRRDRRIASYIVFLCLIGMVFAAGHYAEQVRAAMEAVAGKGLTPCDPSGVSCAATQIFKFGYITIPLMAFTAFTMNTLTSVLMLRHGKAQD